ncbi:MAG TPA: CBS domain-containing protein [Azospirillaceae bacterium]|nr:CBS domain-containing protein [Azospirillaceae bacterium]
MHVAAILKRKGTKVVTTTPDQPIASVAHRLTTHRIGAVVVTGPNDEILGIISERDIIRGLTRHAERALALTAGDLMTREVLTCLPQDTIADLMAIMTARRIRHLPVLVDGRLGGMISIGDVVKARLDETELEVETLRGYAGLR